MARTDAYLHPGSEDEQQNWYIEPEPQRLPALDARGHDVDDDSRTPFGADVVDSQRWSFTPDGASQESESGISSVGSHRKSKRQRSLWPMIGFGVFAITVAGFQARILAPQEQEWVPGPTQPHSSIVIELPDFPVAPLLLGQEITASSQSRAIVEVVCGDLRVQGTLVGLSAGVGATAVITRSEGVAGCAPDQLSVSDGASDVPAQWIGSDPGSGIALVAVPLPLGSLPVLLTDNVDEGMYLTGERPGRVGDLSYVSGLSNRQLEIGATVIDDGKIVGVVGRAGITGTVAVCNTLIKC